MLPLLVILSDRPSEYIKKGEYSAKYYNPGNIFKEVHILLTNDDCPDRAEMQKTVGDAKLFIHNLPTTKRLFITSLGWRPFLLNKWAQPALELARQINPGLIRCHCSYLNVYLAKKIKDLLGIPYIVSLHGNPDADIRSRSIGWRTRLVMMAVKRVERVGLKSADIVLPVYKSIVPYLHKIGIKNYEVVYNVLNNGFLRKKNDYSLHNPVKIICVTRQMTEKKPVNLVRAIKLLPNTHLTMVGNGPCHDLLKSVAMDCKLGDRVEFIHRIPNDELCATLHNYDIFATHSEYQEISKPVLESFFSGLPVVLNKRVGPPVAELEGDFITLVDNTPEGYCNGIKNLIENHDLREKIGARAYDHAKEHWSPEKMEEKTVKIYNKIMRRGD